MAEQLSRVERFLAHLDTLSGGVEPQFDRVDPVGDGQRGVTAIGYRDLPEPGLLLGFTYGLSLGSHDQWRHGRPELSICVRSDDGDWIRAIAHLAATLIQRCPFSYGNTIDFGTPISEASSMDGFVVFAPAALARDDARVDVGDDLPIHVVGMYPTYASERQYIAEHGLQAFWDQEWDPYDVTRPPAV